MVERRRLAPAQIRALARTLVEAGDLLHKVPPAQAAAILGWTVREAIEGFAVVVDTGLPVARGEAELRGARGDLEQIAVMLNDYEGSDEPAAVAYRHDVFAEAVSAVQDEFGAPDEREPGPEPRVVWRVGDVVLLVEQGGYSIALTVASADDWDAEE